MDSNSPITQDSPSGGDPADAWRDQALQRAARAWKWFRAFVWAITESMMDVNIPRMGASLAYTSLLAIVPLAAIGLAMLAAFPAFDQVREEIISQVISVLFPYQQAAVQDYVSRFVSAAGGLTAMGVAGLGLTAVLLLITIEGAFNSIFEVHTPRRAVARVLLYWTVVTVGPLLLGVGFSMSGNLTTLIHWAEEGGLATPVTGLIPVLGPQVMFCLALALLYYLVPNRPVRLLHALIGAVVATLLANVLQEGFLLYLTSARAYETIYGALAVLPIFLVWTYLSWIVVLVGAVTAARLPDWLAARGVEETRNLQSLDRFFLAIRVLRMIHERFTHPEPARAGRGKAGVHGVSRRRLAKDLAVPDQLLSDILTILEQGGIVVRSDSGPWMPGRSYDLITLGEVAQAVQIGLPPVDSLEKVEDAQGVLQGRTADPALRARFVEVICQASAAEGMVLGMTLPAFFALEETPAKVSPLSEAV